MALAHPTTLAKGPGPGSDDSTLTSMTVSRVYSDILTGALLPGNRLVLADLAERYAVGLTPVREALSRLVARGLVVGVSQRGFSVAGTSYDDLVDITRMRVVVERDALAHAIRHGGDAWEAGILAALHIMSLHIERGGAAFDAQSLGFDAVHKTFHTALLSACGSPRLLSAHSDLYDQACRYRLIRMVGLERDTANFLSEHQELASLTLRRQRDEAVAKLERHLQSTLSHVYPDGVDDPA